MSKPFPLVFMAGRRVREHVAAEGFRIEDYPMLLGAAGGPKWLVLYGLDRVLAPRLTATGRRFDLVGASIGAWRFAAYAQRDPAAALDRLLASYTRFDDFRTGPVDMNTVFAGYCRDLLGPHGVDEVLASPHAALHVVVAWLQRARLGLLAALGVAAGMNAVHRRLLLRFGPRRLLLSTAGGERFDAWAARRMLLDRHNLAAALHASAAVPGLVDPVRDLLPGESGIGVDGGILDYHFEGAPAAGGFVLYPHFYPHLVPGWFDKPFRRRRIDPRSLDDVLLIAPSPEFVSRLPNGKIPDRKDPQRLGLDGCHQVWCRVAEASRELGDAFEDAVASGRIVELISRG